MKFLSKVFIATILFQTTAFSQGIYNLWGTTTSGGDGGFSGSLFQYSPAALSGATSYEFQKGEYPLAGLIEYKKKFYGLTSGGGDMGIGTLFEYDPVTKIYTEKISFNGVIGAAPLGELLVYNDKLYGMTSSGGAYDNGVLFEYDPALGQLTNILDFDGTFGIRPSGNLVHYNNKLYGISNNNANSKVFEYDPLLHAISNSQVISGTGNFNSFCVYNNLLYGLCAYDTYGGGKGNLFEYNPALNSVTVKTDFSGTNLSTPFGSLTAYKDKLYAPCSIGGLFEYDPLTDVITELSDLSAIGGTDPMGKMLEYNNKLYGAVFMGNSNAGLIYDYDLANGIVTKDLDFSGLSGSNPGVIGLIKYPAPIAKPVFNTCVPQSVADLSASGTNWMPVVDLANGDAIAELNAHGMNLGTVTTEVYLHQGIIREDAAFHTYLDRNISITSSNNPSGLVSLRLYITDSEYQTLKNSTNSLNDPSGINSIFDVAVYQSTPGCSPVIGGNTSQLSTMWEPWGQYGYVATVNVTALSSFYFAREGVALPVQLLSFDAAQRSHATVLKWNIAMEKNVAGYTIQKSTDGHQFNDIGFVAASGSSWYTFTDPIASSDAYYRLKMTGTDQSFDYSNIVLMHKTANVSYGIYPNPAHDHVSTQVTDDENKLVKLMDMSGQEVIKTPLSPGSNDINIANLPPGLYLFLISELNGSPLQQGKMIIE